MPAVPLRGLAFQAPSESAPNDMLCDSANHVEPRPIAPAMTKDNNNPMSSRTFGLASAGTLEMTPAAQPAPRRFPRSMFQTYIMIAKNCRHFRTRSSDPKRQGLVRRRSIQFSSPLPLAGEGQGGGNSTAQLATRLAEQKPGEPLTVSINWKPPPHCRPCRPPVSAASRPAKSGPPGPRPWRGRLRP